MNNSIFNNILLSKDQKEIIKEINKMTKEEEKVEYLKYIENDEIKCEIISFFENKLNIYKSLQYIKDNSIKSYLLIALDEPQYQKLIEQFLEQNNAELNSQILNKLIKMCTQTKKIEFVKKYILKLKLSDLTRFLISFNINESVNIIQKLSSESHKCEILNKIYTNDNSNEILNFFPEIKLRIIIENSSRLEKINLLKEYNNKLTVDEIYNYLNNLKDEDKIDVLNNIDLKKRIEVLKKIYIFENNEAKFILNFDIDIIEKIINEIENISLIDYIKKYPNDKLIKIITDSNRDEYKKGLLNENQMHVFINEKSVIHSLEDDEYKITYLENEIENYMLGNEEIDIFISIKNTTEKLELSKKILKNILDYNNSSLMINLILNEQDAYFKIKFLDFYIENLNKFVNMDLFDNVKNLILYLNRINNEKYLSKIILECTSIEGCIGNGIFTGDLLNFLEENNIQTNYTEMLIKNYNMVKELKKDLYYKNPSLVGELLEDYTLSMYGVDVIVDILEYNTNAQRILIEYKDDSVLQNWINYSKRTGIYGKKFLHKSLSIYKKNRNLFEEIINNTKFLIEEELQILNEILDSSNFLNIKNYEEFKNYNEIKKEKIKSDINELKSPTEEATLKLILKYYFYNGNINYFMGYNIDDKEYMQYFIDNGLLSIEEEATLKIIQELESYSIEYKGLYNKFMDVINKKINITTSIINLKEKFTKHYSKIMADNLIDLSCIEENKNVIIKYIDGNDKKNKLKIIDFNGIDFKILKHSFGRQGINHDMIDASKELYNNPSAWNYLDIVSSLSTSLISNYSPDKFSCSNSNRMVYGFCKIPEDSVFAIGREDVEVEHTHNKLEPKANPQCLDYLYPDVLIKETHGAYNEVALYRKSKSIISNNGKIQPSCIIVDEEQDINSDIKKHAEYFNIPICVINKEKYRQINDEKDSKYLNKNISTFNLADIKNILYSRKIELNIGYKLVLELCDKSLNEQLINEEEYIYLLKETKNIIRQFCIRRRNLDISLIDNRIKKILLEEYKKVEEYIEKTK